MAVFCLVHVFLEDADVLLYISWNLIALLELNWQVFIYEFKCLEVYTLLVDASILILREHYGPVLVQEAKVAIVELVAKTVFLVHQPSLYQAEPQHYHIAVRLVPFVDPLTFFLINFALK